MRMTAFLMGGILGAAVAIYFVRNREKLGMVSSVLGQTGQMANSMMVTVKGSLQDAAIKALDAALSRGMKEESGSSGESSVQH